MDNFFRNRNWLAGVGIAILAVFVLPVYANAAGPTVADLFTGGYWGNPATGLMACEGKICTSLCQLLDLLNNLLFFGLTILIYIIAPIRFIIGGFMIMIGGTSEGLSKGKAMIKGTVIGLLIALGSFIIVATFLWLIGNNSSGSGQARVSWPEIECQPGTVPYSDTGTGGGGGDGDGDGDGTGPGGTNHANNLAQLQAADIRVWSSGVIQANCTTANCTSLEGLPQTAIAGLIRIKSECDTLYHVTNNTLLDCDLVVTAGTEVLGHETHGPGRAIVDIDNTPSVDAYINNLIGISNPTLNTWYDTPYFATYYEGDHWHICFSEPCYR